MPVVVVEANISLGDAGLHRLHNDPGFEHRVAEQIHTTCDGLNGESIGQAHVRIAHRSSDRDIETKNQRQRRNEYVECF